MHTLKAIVAALKVNIYPILSFEAKKLNMGSNVSRDPVKECIERRPWKPLRKLSKDSTQTADILGHVILIQPETASGIMFTRP